MKTQKYHFYSKLLLLIAFLVVSFGSITNAFSQRINVNVTVLPPYPIYLENYINKGNAVIITLTNLSPETQKIRLIPALEGNNGVSIKVKPSFFPVAPIILNANQTRTFTYNQLQSFNANLTENDVQIQGVSTSTLVQNEALPEGSYSLCIKAFDFESNEVLSSEFGCASILITNYDPPIMVLPLHEAKIAPMNPQFVNFVWTPAGMPAKTRYRLQIVDMSANNLFNINDAFNNPAIQTYFDKDNIITNTFSYTQAMPPLQKGRKYAIRVTAYDPTKSIQFKNQGHSPVTSFVYDTDNIVIINDGGGNGNGEQNNDQPKDVIIVLNNNELPNNENIPKLPQDPQDSPDCLANCQNAAPSPSAPMKLLVGQEISVGKFKLKITSINANNSGEGTILVAFLNAPIKVKFTDLKVNDALQLFEGNIYAKVDNQNLISTAVSENPNADLQSVVSKAKEINQFLGNASRQVSKMGGNVPIGLPLSLNNNGYDLAIVGIIFTPTEAKLHMLLGVEIPQILQNELFTLTGVGLGIRPNGFCADTQGKISLTSDKSYSLSTDLNLVFEAGQANTYANFSCKGIEKVGLKGNLEWSREKVLPYQNDKVVEGNAKLKATFKTEIEQSGDWIFEGIFNYPSFVLPSAQNLVFSAPSLSLDLSGKKTPDAVKQKHQKGNDWVGIYIQNLSVTLPKIIQKNGKSFVLEANEFIFDKLGFSGKIDLNGNLLSINDGNTSTWGISIEKFGFTLVNNSLTGGAIKGALKVPLTDAPLGYEGSIVQANQAGKAAFNFAVITNKDYTVSAWIATLKLEEDAKITISEEKVSAELTGYITIDWADGKGKDNVKLESNSVSSFSLPNIRFEKMLLEAGAGKNFITSWASFGLDNFKSVQANISKFPLTLKEDIKLITQGDVYGITLSPELVLMNATQGINGSTTFTIFGKFDKNSKKFHYEKTTLQDIDIFMGIGVAFIDAHINLYSQDDLFGNGFRGAAKITVKNVFTVQSVIQFGRTLDKQNKEGFRYWYFDALIKIDTGIPVTATQSLYAFGGGMWYNMKLEKSIKDEQDFNEFKQVNNTNAKNETADVTYSGNRYVPNNGSVGFKANVAFGLTGTPSAFNANLEFKLNLKKDNQGNLKTESVFLSGQAFFMTPMNLPIGEKLGGVKAYVDIEINPEQRLFHLLGGIEVDATIIEAKGTIEMLFQGTTEQQNAKWYIKIGQWTEGKAEDEPWNDDQRLQVTIDLALVELKFNGYFMLGSDIPNRLPAVPALVRNMYPKKIDENATVLAAQTGSGFSMGVGFYTEFHANFLFLYADFKAAAGFDILIINREGSQCNGSNNFGIKKWRAEGQAYVYLDGDAGFQARIFGKDRKLSLISLKASALLNIEVPNPNYVAGAFAVKGKILGGLIKINMSYDFERGTKCEYTSGPKNPFDGYPIITELSPDKNSKASKKMSVMTDPAVSFNMAILKDKTKPNAVTYPKNIYKLVSEGDGQGSGDKVNSIFTELEKAELSYQENGKKILVAGKLVLDGNTQKTAFFQADEALKPSTTFTFAVKVTGWEIIDGKNILQAKVDTTTTFTTDEGLKYIPEGEIVSAYPFSRERFYYTHVSDGEITMSKSICNQPLFQKWFPSQGSTKFVSRFTNLTTGESVDKSVEGCWGPDIKFEVPVLKSSTIYEISIVRIDIPVGATDFIATNISQTEKNLGGSSVAYYTTLKNKNKSSDKNKETKLLSYHFRTGKYKNEKDKINAMSTSSKVAEVATVYQAGQPVEVVMITLESDEPIDVLNAYGFDTGTRQLGFGSDPYRVPPVTHAMSMYLPGKDHFVTSYLKEHFDIAVNFGIPYLQFQPNWTEYRYASANSFGIGKRYKIPFYDHALYPNTSVMFYRPKYLNLYGANNKKFVPKMSYTLPMDLLSNSEIQEAKAKAPKQTINVGNVGLQISMPPPPKSQFNTNLPLKSNTKYYIPIIDYSNVILACDIIKFKKYAADKFYPNFEKYYKDFGISNINFTLFYNSFEIPLVPHQTYFQMTIGKKQFSYQLP